MLPFGLHRPSILLVLRLSYSPGAQLSYWISANPPFFRVRMIFHSDSETVPYDPSTGLRDSLRHPGRISRQSIAAHTSHTLDERIRIAGLLADDDCIKKGSRA